MIIAIKEKDRVVIGYTNLDFWTNLSDKDYIDEENVAINLSRAGKVFAFAKMDKSTQILFYDESLLNVEISPKNIVRQVIPYIKVQLQKGGECDDKNKWDNALLICDDLHVYCIGPTFNFVEASDYVCYGRAEKDNVLSVLDQTTELSAEERIKEAIRFTSKLRKESLYPFVITDTKTRKVKIINEGEN